MTIHTLSAQRKVVMTTTISSSNQWRASRCQQCLFPTPSLLLPYFSTARKRFSIVKLCRSNMSINNSKKANLSAAKKQRIKLPDSSNGCRFNEFLSHSSGIQAMLNTSALQSFQSLDTNIYRCVLPKFQLLSFEAAPVLDLRVTPTEEDCTVEMLSCKFQGSEILERQNEHFTGVH